MRLLKITALAFTLVVGPVLLESCCFSDCCFESFEEVYYNIEDVTMTPTPFPATSPFPSLPSTAVQLSTVAFHFNIEVAYIAHMHQQSFGAFACDPAPPISKQTIQSIEITSSLELGGIPTGEPINTLFQIYFSDSDTGHAVDEVVGLTHLPYLTFRTTAEVTASCSQVFIFRITLDDGRLFHLVSERLELKP